MKPKRIQRKRTKGYRMPEGAVSVTRPGKWGNLFKVGTQLCEYDIHKDVLEQAFPDGCDEYLEQEITLDDSLRLYRAYVLHRWEYYSGFSPYELRGKDLACWCRLSDACHADVLLELANQEAR